MSSYDDMKKFIIQENGGKEITLQEARLVEATVAPALQVGEQMLAPAHGEVSRGLNKVIQALNQEIVQSVNNLGFSDQRGQEPLGDMMLRKTMEAKRLVQEVYDAISLIRNKIASAKQ